MIFFIHNAELSFVPNEEINSFTSIDAAEPIMACYLNTFII